MAALITKAERNGTVIREHAAALIITDFILLIYTIMRRKGRQRGIVALGKAEGFASNRKGLRIPQAFLMVCGGADGIRTRDLSLDRAPCLATTPRLLMYW